MELSALINTVRGITRNQALVGMTWFRSDNKSEPGIVALSSLRLAVVYAVNGGLRFNTYKGHYQYGDVSRLEVLPKYVVNQFELAGVPASVPAFPQTHPGMAKTCMEILTAMCTAADTRTTALPMVPKLPEIYLGSCPRNPLAPEFDNACLLRACEELHPGKEPTHALQASVFHSYVAQATDGRIVYPAAMFLRKQAAYKRCPVTDTPMPTIAPVNGTGLGAWFADGGNWRPRLQPMVGAYADLSTLFAEGANTASLALRDVCNSTDIDITDADGLACLQHLLGVARTGAFDLWRKHGVTACEAVTQLDNAEVARVSSMLQSTTDTRLGDMLVDMRQLLNTGADAAEDVALGNVATDLDIVKVLLDPRQPLPMYTQIMSAYAKTSKVYSDTLAWEQFTADVAAAADTRVPAGVQPQVIRLTSQPCMESLYWADLTSKIGLYITVPNNASSTQKSRPRHTATRTHA